MTLPIKILHKIHHKITKVRLQPIRILGFHHVADSYDGLHMWRCDYTQTELFKRNILEFIHSGYTFISLTEAHSHIKRDLFRRKKYAALTADDGYKTLLNIIPWLLENSIPITLFINTAYLDGMHCGENNVTQAQRFDPDVSNEQICDNLFLTGSDIKALLDSDTKGLITIASHGHEHLRASEIDDTTFRHNIEQCVGILKRYTCFIPYHAYTYDDRTEQSDTILNTLGLTPIMISGRHNYGNHKWLDRECIDGCVISDIDIKTVVRYKECQLENEAAHNGK